MWLPISEAAAIELGVDPKLAAAVVELRRASAEQEVRRAKRAHLGAEMQVRGEGSRELGVVVAWIVGADSQDHRAAHAVEERLLADAEVDVAELRARRLEDDHPERLEVEGAGEATLADHPVVVDPHLVDAAGDVLELGGPEVVVRVGERRDRRSDRRERWVGERRHRREHPAPRVVGVGRVEALAEVERHALGADPARVELPRGEREEVDGEIRLSERERPLDGGVVVRHPEVADVHDGRPHRVGEPVRDFGVDVLVHLLAEDEPDDRVSDDEIRELEREEREQNPPDATPGLTPRCHRRARSDSTASRLSISRATCRGRPLHSVVVGVVLDQRRWMNPGLGRGAGDGSRRRDLSRRVGRLVALARAVAGGALVGEDSRAGWPLPSSTEPPTRSLSASRAAARATGSPRAACRARPWRRRTRRDRPAASPAHH